SLVHRSTVAMKYLLLLALSYAVTSVSGAPLNPVSAAIITGSVPGAPSAAAQRDLNGLSTWERIAILKNTHVNPGCFAVYKRSGDLEKRGKGHSSSLGGLFSGPWTSSSGLLSKFRSSTTSSSGGISKKMSGGPKSPTTAGPAKNNNGNFISRF